MRFLVLCTLVLAACQQTKAYTPDLAPVPVRLESLRGVALTVTDLRVEQEAGDAMAKQVREQLSRAIPEVRDAAATEGPKLTVDIIEHRAFFTLGNWNGATRFRAVVTKADGAKSEAVEASGTSRRANSMGYSTAKRVSQDSYNAAIAELLSKLR